MAGEMMDYKEVNEMEEISQNISKNTISSLGGAFDSHYHPAFPKA